MKNIFTLSLSLSFSFHFQHPKQSGRPRQWCCPSCCLCCWFHQWKRGACDPRVRGCRVSLRRYRCPVHVSLEAILASDGRPGLKSRLCHPLLHGDGVGVGHSRDSRVGSVGLDSCIHESCRLLINKPHMKRISNSQGGKCSIPCQRMLP